MLVDLRVAELLCSRLCHDLVSPVGAVNTGVEILSEGGGPGVYDEALSLLTRSADEAARRLKFFRAAYGLGGADGAPLALGDLRELAEGALRERLNLSWPQSLRQPRAALGRGRARLLLNAIALAAEALPRGGDIAVAGILAADGGGEALAANAPLHVAASGPGAGLKEEQRLALDPARPADELTARSIQAHFLALLAAQAGGRLQVVEAPDHVDLGILFPGGA